MPVVVYAISFNDRDPMLEEGLFNQKLKLPRTPCSDGACKAAAVGEGVSGRLDGRKVRLPPPGLFAAAGET